MKPAITTSRCLRATALATLGTVAFTGVAGAATYPSLPGDPPTPPSEDPTSPRPNIVAFVLDDIPPMDGRLWDRLPNIRKTFVQEGVEFTNAHVESPTCTPGRIGFLTGQHSHKHGAFRTDGTTWNPSETVATELQSEGYHTIEVGKYINLFDRAADKFPPGWNEFHGTGGGYYDYNLYSNGRQRRFGSRPNDYSTDVFRRIASGALGRAPNNKPVFAWIAPYTSHKPWTVAKRHQGKRCNVAPWKPHGFMEKNVRDKPAYLQQRELKSRVGYKLERTCRGMLAVDQLVGEVVRKLRRQGRLDNTMLILTSDNGMSFGSQRILDDKKAPYGSQVPFFVRWPRLLGAQPRQIDERIQNIDLAPTLCAIAGCRMGPYPTGHVRADGTSFLKLLTGERQTLNRTGVLSTYLEDGHRVPRYRSITTTAASPLAKKLCAGRKQAKCRWTFTVYETGERELYDISNRPCHEWKRRKNGDPCHLQNRAGQKKYAAVQRQLANELARLLPGL